MIAFAADDPAEIDIYAVLGRMAERVWLLNGLQRRPAVQLCVTLRHSEAGMVDHLVRDLDLTVTGVRSDPGAEGSRVPVYGLIGTVETRGTAEDLLTHDVDMRYRP